MSPTTIYIMIWQGRRKLGLISILAFFLFSCEEPGEIGLELNPDMVLLSFFIGNDVIDNANTLLKKRQLYSYSYVASFFHYLINIQPRFKGGGKDTTYDYCDTCQSYSYPDYLKVEKRSNPSAMAYAMTPRTGAKTIPLCSATR